MDYTATEVLLRERTAERDRATLGASGDHRRQERATPSGTAGYDQQPAEAPLIWVDTSAGDSEPLGEPISDTASSAAEVAGEAATGFLEAAGHLAGEVLNVLGAILSALGHADLGD